MQQVVNVMQITLYQNNSDNRTVDKQLQQIMQPVNAIPTDDMSILYPVITLDYNAEYIEANYAYIPLFKRYYYITERTVTIGKRIIMSMAVDVRRSWIYHAGNCDVTVVRNEGIGKPTLYPDNKLPIYPNKKNITSIIMPETSSSFTGDGDTCYLLTCIGGEPTE